MNSLFYFLRNIKNEKDLKNSSNNMTNHLRPTWHSYKVDHPLITCLSRKWHFIISHLFIPSLPLSHSRYKESISQDIYFPLYNNVTQVHKSNRVSTSIWRRYICKEDRLVYLVLFCRYSLFRREFLILQSVTKIFVYTNM